MFNIDRSNSGGFDPLKFLVGKLIGRVIGNGCWDWDDCVSLSKGISIIMGASPSAANVAAVAGELLNVGVLTKAQFFTAMHIYSSKQWELIYDIPDAYSRSTYHRYIARKDYYRVIKLINEYDAKGPTN